MRGSAAFRVAVAPGGALAGPWVQNSLWTAARAVPSLDLRFADNKSLVDATTGASLVTFTRASSGTYVGSDGLIKTAVTNLLLRSEEFDNAAWIKTTSTVSSNVIVAPNGTLTSDKFVEGSGSVTPILAQAVSVTSGASYTFTVYAKEDLTGAKRYLTLLLPSAQFGSNVRVTFNLANGTSVSTNNPDATSIIFVGDGWYRCSVTEAATSTGSAGVQIRVSNASPDTLGSYTGDGTSGIYLWGAQLEQSSTVGEYVPTTSVINAAPRFDHNPTTGESLGLLVEEARTNFLLQSQDFTTTWSQTNVTNTPNTTISPDSSTNADTLVINAIAASTNQTTQTFTAGSTITVSVFAKKNTSNFVRFELGSLCSCWFNLNTGATGSNTAGSGNVLFSAKSIQPFGNGWYRCVLTVTTTTITTLTVAIFATNVDNTTSAVDSSVFLWGVVAEVGAFVTSYIPTTTATVTRAADVASITGSNFGITRTNLLLQSQNFSTSWINTNLTPTSGAIAPDGTATAFTVNEGTAAAAAHSTHAVPALTASNIMTLSVHAKNVNARYVGLAISTTSSNNYGTVEFDLNGTGAVNRTAVSGTGFSIISFSISAVGSGWFRCVAVIGLGSASVSDGRSTIYVSDGASSFDNRGRTAYTGTSRTLEIWGAQLETSSAVTPYIPTTTATVSVFESSFYNQTEGTVFADAKVTTVAPATSLTSVFALSDGTTSNRITVYKRANADTSTRLDVSTSGSSVAFINAGTFSVSNLIAASYRVDDFAISLNGLTPGTDTLGAVPTISRLNIGSYADSTFPLNGTLKRLTYWGAKLPNLQAITQP